MKNRKIIHAWQAIEPDSAADARMLVAILARNPSGKTKMKEAFTMKNLNWKRLAPIAACLVLTVAAVAVMGGTGLFGLSVQAMELGNGETVNFNKANAPRAATLDFGVNVISRDLTAEENEALFGSMPVTAFGMFDADSKQLLHIEGKNGNTKIIVGAPGLLTTDVILSADPLENEDIRRIILYGIEQDSFVAFGEQGASSVTVEYDPSGFVLVSADYFVTKANSRGERNIIYFATLDMDGTKVYIECGGNKKDSDSLKEEMAAVIDALAQNGAPNLAKVTG